MASLRIALTTQAPEPTNGTALLPTPAAVDLDMINGTFGRAYSRQVLSVLPDLLTDVTTPRRIMAGTEDEKQVMAFEALCKMHGTNAAEVGATIFHVAMNTPDSVLRARSTNKEALARKYDMIAHPTFLDLPPASALNKWMLDANLFGVTLDEARRSRVEAFVEPNAVAWLVGALTRPELRRAAEATGANGNNLNAAMLEDVLERAGTPGGNLRSIDSGAAAAPLPPGVEPLTSVLHRAVGRQSAAQFTVYEARQEGVDGGPGASPDRIVSHVVSEQHATGRMIDDVRRHRTQDIADSRYVAFNIWDRDKTSRDKPLTPTAAHELLFGAKPDALLHAWSKKWRLDDQRIEVGQMHQGPVPLTEAWEKLPDSLKSKYNAFMPKALAWAEQQDPPLFTLAGLDHKLGRHAVSALSASDPGTLWVWPAKRMAGELPKMTRPLRELVNGIGLSLEDAVTLMPWPQRAGVTLSTTARRTTAAATGPWDGFSAEARSALGKFGTPDSLAAAAAGLLSPMARQDAETRAALIRAMKEPPFAAINAQQGGMPSLPHLLLLWAAKPETQGMTHNATMQAFGEIWGALPSAGAKDVKHGFAWAAVETARREGKLYPDFETTFRATSGVAWKTVDRLVSAPSDQPFNTAERGQARLLLDWLNRSSDNAAVAYLGGGREAVRVVARFKNAAPA